MRCKHRQRLRRVGPWASSEFRLCVHKIPWPLDQSVVNLNSRWQRSHLLVFIRWKSILLCNKNMYTSLKTCDIASLTEHLLLESQGKRERRCSESKLRGRVTYEVWNNWWMPERPSLFPVVHSFLCCKYTYFVCPYMTLIIKVGLISGDHENVK